MSTERAQIGWVAGQVPVLRARRIVLRPLREDDAPRIQSLVNDFEVVRWMGRIPYPYAIDDARYFIERVAPSEMSWALEARDEGLVGVGGFAFKADSTDIELGYWFGRSHWGFGFATEAARRMLSHAWACGAQRVFSGYFDGNARSGHVLEKCGFRIVGRSLRFNLARGTDLSHIDMILDRPSRIDVEVS